jgi:hypothetical protein
MFAGYINTLAELHGLRARKGKYNSTKVEEKYPLERMVEDYRHILKKL